MTDRERLEQVTQDNEGLIDRNRDLETELAMCKQALGECKRVASQLFVDATCIEHAGQPWISTMTVKERMGEIKNACEGTYEMPKPEDMSKRNSYNQLSEEDRETLRWVRDQGGLEVLRKLADVCDLVKNSNDELRLRVDLYKGVLNGVCKRLGLTDGAGMPEQDGVIYGELEKRLMPEGMEWPTVDGKPVDFVTGYEPSLGVIEAVSIYSNGACEVMGHDGIIKDVKEIHIATPKVLDADGVEIRVGDEVWDVVTGRKRTVRAVNGSETVEFDGYENRGWSKFLTHRAPILAADGKPLHEGETVWSVDSGIRYTVEKITDELIPIKCHSDMGSTVSLFPSQLTHERPDSWDRLEADAGKNPFDYCKDVGHRLDTCENSEAYKARDLVRRAKKLAGRDAS